MYHKNLLLFLLIISIHFTQAQKPDNFGKVTNLELNMTVYDKDTTANAVMLFERGDNYFKVINRSIKLIKKYHGKIKLLNEKAFDLATVEIGLYHSKSGTEKITHISAVTHNGKEKSNVIPSEIFTTDINENWREKKFTFPKLKPGSIIEYAYTIETPFYFNLTGWNFQTNIPVMYSEFNAKIPGNWTYNRALYGKHPLDVNQSKVAKECF